MDTNPYLIERDYFDELPPDAREWMKRYTRACEHGNMEVLYELCVEAPTDGFERLKAEIKYEKDFYKRNTLVLTNSSYNEQDYGWSDMMKIKDAAITDASLDCWGGVFKGVKGE